jgi:hypothetical protein
MVDDAPEVPEEKWDEKVSTPLLHRFTRELREMLTHMDSPKAPAEIFGARGPELAEAEGLDGKVMVWRCMDVYEVLDTVEENGYPVPQATLTIQDHLDAAHLLARELDDDELDKAIMDAIETYTKVRSR